jgi:hypothetical protein
MRRLFLTLLFAATAFAQPIRQQKSVILYEPANAVRTQPPSARVRALIRQLESPSPDSRAAAERILLSLCPGIAPQLRYALAEEEKSAPASLPKSYPVTQEYVRGGDFGRFQPYDLLPRAIYHSLGALIEHCEELQHTKPALINLNANDALLSEIFRQMGEQIGVPVSVMARSYTGGINSAALDWFQSARATVQVTRVPYWAALRTILEAIHAPSFAGVQLFIVIGNNQIELNPSTSDSADIFRNPNTFSAGPLLLLPTYHALPNPHFAVTVVADPALWGFTGNSSLHIETLTDDKGHSLLLDGINTSNSGGLDEKDRQDKIGYVYDNASGKFSWRQSLVIKAPEAGGIPAVVHGTFSIGFGINENLITHAPEREYPGNNIGIPLVAFHPEDLGSKPTEEKIFLLQDCRMLQPESADKAVYLKDPLDCNARSIERGGGGAGRDKIEGVTLTLTNHRDHAVTYVAGLAYFVNAVPGFPVPDQIANFVGMYHAHADPGQTVQISMATSYQMGSPSAVSKVPDTIPAPASSIKPASIVFDGLRLSILTVTRVGEVFEIVGQLALPSSGPFGDTAVGPGYIFLNLLDAQGWRIESYPYFSKIRPEGDHLVEDFKVTTREPGRVPGVLLWQTPAATHWLSTPFEIRMNENEQH